MVRINLEQMKRVEKSRNYVHNKVLTTYTVFEIEGQKYLQLDTYGNCDRKNPDKISQSIQFDKGDAINIVNLLKQEFDI